MVEEKRDTVVVENDRNRSPLGWIIGLAIVVILIILFFSYGGFGLFTGGNGGSTTNNSVNVQPSSGTGTGQ